MCAWRYSAIHTNTTHKGVKMGNKGGRPSLGNSLMTPEKIKMAIKSTQSMGQAALYMGASKQTFKKYAKLYDLWSPAKTSKGIKRSSGGQFKWDMKLILEGKNPNPYREDTLMTKAIREGYMKCECNNCQTNFEHVSDKQPPLILDFLDRNTQNTKIDNLRALCLNCLYTLSESKKGWYRHRESPLGYALDNATPISTKDMDSVVRKTKDTASIASDNLQDAPIAVPDDAEVEYMPFEEFQKLL